MGLLKRKLSGSTIIEVIVSSLVFLLAFTISLSTVTGFTLREDEGYTLLEAERRLAACIDRYGNGTWPQSIYEESHPWGNITIRIAPYKDFENIQTVVLSAQLTGSRKTIEYRILAVKDYD
jgi:hypothetical protein